MQFWIKFFSMCLVSQKLLSFIGVTIHAEGVVKKFQFLFQGVQTSLSPDNQGIVITIGFTVDDHCVQ